MILIFIFILGICIGSFLNVLIDRLPFYKSPLKGRSKCDFCRKTLAPVDLIPIISYLMLKGRCRYCHKKLSWQYPLVEIFTGLMFVFIYIYQVKISNYEFLISHQFLNALNLSVLKSYFPLLFIFSSFLVIFISDLKYQIIPDEMLVVIIVGIIGYKISSGVCPDIIRTGMFLNDGILDNLLTTILSGFGAGLFFLLIYLITRGKGMGFGDVKLAPLLGLFLSYPKIIVALYLAFLTGAAVSIILVLLGKKGLKQTIAFGPFLLIGTSISFFWGHFFWLWYLSFFK